MRIANGSALISVTRRLFNSGQSAAIAATLFLLSLDASGMAPEPWVEVLTGLHPHAAISYSEDSNLLRLSDEELPLVPGGGDGSDSYVTLEAGVSTRLHLSRQRVLLSARVYENDYEKFSEYDHKGGDARVVWRWVYGALWNGDLGYSYSRKLRGFANQEVPIKDMIDRHRFRLTANRWLTPHWKLGAGVVLADISSGERDSLDKQLRIGEATLDFVTEAETSLGFLLEHTDAKFDIDSGRDYTETFLGPRIDWAVSSRTAVEATAGLRRREHDMLSERDFDGLVAEIIANWQITEKTAITAAASRDLSSLNDEIAGFAVIEKIGIETTWNITDKTRLRGAARYEERDFQGGASTPVLAQRVDDIHTYGVWLDWEFLRNGLFTIGLESEDRVSNRAREDYEFEVFMAKVRLGL